MNYETIGFRWHHEDTLVNLARNEGLETPGEIRELLERYLLDLEEQADLVKDGFLEGLIYAGLKEIDVTIIEDNICDILEIDLDT